MPIRRYLALTAALVLSGCLPEPPTAPDAMLVGATALPAGPTMADTARAPAGARRGTFRGLAGHNAIGTVTMTVENGIVTLLFDSDFVSSGVPGPYVYLADGDDVNRGMRVRIGRLINNAGAQSYRFTMPAGGPYDRVIVWCDPFNVGVATATLR